LRSTPLAQPPAVKDCDHEFEQEQCPEFPRLIGPKNGLKSVTLDGLQPVPTLDAMGTFAAPDRFTSWGWLDDELSVFSDLVANDDFVGLKSSPVIRKPFGATSPDPTMLSP
jgi:hypothetical protein